MSTIYLPNGSKIIAHVGWNQTQEPNGNLTLRSNDGKNVFYGVITNAGVCHFTESFIHTFIPAGIKKLEDAYLTVSENIKGLSIWELKKLRDKLKDYNYKQKYWK